MILLVIKGKEMFNQLVYNAIIPKKEREEREVSIKYGELFLHDGVNATASIEYLEGKATSREQEQISRDTGVFFGQKKGIKTIKINGRLTADNREDLLNKIETMKAKLAKNTQEALQVKEGERAREWRCVVKKFALSENHRNMNWMERELELMTRGYGQSIQPRVIEQDISQNETIIPIERGGTAPAQLGWIYTITQAGENFKIELGSSSFLLKKSFQVGDIIQLEEKKLTVNGEIAGFEGILPRLEQENESLKITTGTRGNIQIFYFLSYE